MTNAIIEALGVTCLAGFAALVWPPAVLLVLGAALLLLGWTRS